MTAINRPDHKTDASGIIRRSDPPKATQAECGVSIEQAVERYGGMLMRIACHYLACRADAEDAVQEAFLRWLKGGRGPHGLRGEEAVKAWLIRVTINICKDQCKSARRRCVPLEEGQQAAREMVSPVLGEVMALPEQYRAVVYLYYYEGYTLREIARLLGKNEHTVQSWHRRAKAILRDALGGIDNELETKI